jgi:hypothetical protein
LPLFPIFLFYIARREGWRRATLSAVVAVIPVAVLSLPYTRTFGSFRFDLMAGQLNRITAGSLYAFFFYVCRFVAPASLTVFALILKILLWSVAAVWIVRECHRFVQDVKSSFERLLSTCASILFAIIFVGSAQFFPWYIGMLFPTVLLLHSGHWLRQLVILLNGTHVLSLTSLARKGIGYFALTTGTAVAGQRISK